jgi:hypothetical protein
MTDEEASEFDIERLIGVNCQVNVVHVPFRDGSGVFAAVKTIVPAPRGSQKLEIEGYQRMEKRVSPDANDQEWNNAGPSTNGEEVPF